MVAINANTDQVEPILIQIRDYIDTAETALNNIVTTTSATVNNLQSLHLDLVDLISLSNQVTNALALIDQRLQNIELLLQRRYRLLWRDMIDATTIAANSGGAQLDFSPAAIGVGVVEKITITNITGDGSNITDQQPYFELWLFGRYHINGSPNGSPDRTNYDFVVKPGETLELVSPEGFVLTADGAPGAFGQFTINIFGY